MGEGTAIRIYATDFSRGYMVGWNKDVRIGIMMNAFRGLVKYWGFTGLLNLAIKPIFENRFN